MFFKRKEKTTMSNEAPKDSYKDTYYLDHKGRVVKSASGTTAMGASRLKMLRRLVPEQELRQAIEADLGYQQLAQLFDVGHNDIAVLKFVYGIERRQDKPHTDGATVTTIEPVRTPIDPDEIADRVLTLTMQKLALVIDSEVKMAIAKALHEAADSIADART